MKILELLYPKIFVNIVVEKTKTLVYIAVYAKNKVQKQVHKEFETTELTKTMHEFIGSYTKQTPYFYISYLDKSHNQGAIPTCDKHNIPLYVDMSTSEYKCFENRWIFYTAKSDMYAVERNYKEIGIDFIFSPFSVLGHFFQDKIKSHIALFVLVQEESMSIAVFEDNMLLYGQYVLLDFEENNLFDTSESITMEDELDEIDDSIDLEDMEVDDSIEALEDFGDIEDLDSLEDIEDFSENQDFEEEFLEENREEKENTREKQDEFNDDYQRFSLIERSVSIFYSDKKYKSSFLENVYIADSIGVSGDLKRYLEEEMFLNVYLRHIDLSVEVCTLAQEEV